LIWQNPELLFHGHSRPGGGKADFANDFFMDALLKARPMNDVDSPSVIPTLAEVNPDGLYLIAYCPFCDKSEKAKVTYPGQPREDVACVGKIRAHMQSRHRQK
jgi:hypothetical protein